MANPLKFAALVSFCGLVVSSGISSAFDWEVLLNPSKFEYITNVNLAALYCLFALFSLLAFYLIYGSFKLKVFSSIFTVCIAAFLPFFVLSRGSVILPAVRKIHGDIFVRNCKEPPYSVVIFDDDYNLKSAMAILRELGLSERIYICKNSWQNREKLPREKFAGAFCMIGFGLSFGIFRLVNQKARERTSICVMMSRRRSPATMYSSASSGVSKYCSVSGWFQR